MLGNLTIQEVRLPDLRVFIKIETEFAVESEEFRKLKEDNPEYKKFVLVNQGNIERKFVK